MISPVSRFSRPVALVAWAAAAPLLPAQNLPASLQVVQVEPAPGGKVHVIASVLDSSGQPVRDLGRTNFSLAIGRQKLEDFTVERIAEAGKPLSVLLLLDVSGSMKGQAIAAAKQAAVAFLDELNRGDACALTVFGTGVRHPVEFTPEKRRVRTAIEGLDARDQKTWLNQAVYESLDRAARATGSRTALLVMTDGKDEGSPLHAEEVISRAGTANVPVYALAFGPKADVEFLQRLASLTHGAFYATPDPQQLTAIYSQIGRQLAAQYLLAAVMPTQGAGAYRLDLTVEQRGRSAGAAYTFNYEGIPAAREAEPTGWRRWLPRRAWILAAAAIALIVTALVGVLVFLRIRAARRHRAPDEMPTMPVHVWLEVTKGPSDVGFKFPVIDKEIIIGRSRKQAQVVLSNDSLISRLHAKVQLTKEGQFVLEDCESLTGTRVNGMPLTEARPLQPGDSIEIGQYMLTFLDHRRRAADQKPAEDWWERAVQAEQRPPGDLGSTVGEIVDPEKDRR